VLTPYGRPASSCHTPEMGDGFLVPLSWPNSTTLNSLSSRRKSGGGFTFEVQQLFAEDFSRGVEVKTLSGGIVVDGDEGVEMMVGDGCAIGFA
jgi:hypothetical protein